MANSTTTAAAGSGFPAPAALKPSDFDVIFFDCDDCLYFNEWATADLITKAIEGYCTKTLGLPDGEAYALYKRHGTALKGLLLENILAEDKIEHFLKNVHDVDHARDIHTDAPLREMLGRVKPARWVFTASTRQHATRCMECLGVADMFVDIVDTRDCKLETKYAEASFAAAMAKAGVTDPKRCMLLDDSVGNIKTANKFGFYAVLVGSEMRDGSGKKDCPEADVVLESIHEMDKIMPGLF